MVAAKSLCSVSGLTLSAVLLLISLLMTSPYSALLDFCRVLSNQVDAEKAVNELGALGLPEDGVRVLRRGDAGGGGLFSSFANVFSSGNDPVSNELTRMGLSREEAEFYEEELHDEGVLVTARVSEDDHARVMNIMRDANGVTRT